MIVRLPLIHCVKKHVLVAGAVLIQTMNVQKTDGRMMEMEIAIMFL